MTDREKVIHRLERCLTERQRPSMQDLHDALALLQSQEPITGETSDGYHTFNELYHHRAVLFSVIVNNYKDLAWKSVRHHDGTMYDGMFIVGIDTPDGQATYHYDINSYWDMFKCRVREFAPEWDGHTPAQAIERIGKLKAQEPRVMTLEEVLDNAGDKGMPCWVEDYIINDKVTSLIPAVITSDENYIEYSGSPYYEGAIYVSDYNKRLRCWTSRPSEAQREAVKWE